MDSAVSPREPPRRRNGLRQACEPCRKKKLACDHGLPVCGRCKRRRGRASAVSQCVYLSSVDQPGRIRTSPSSSQQQRSPQSIPGPPTPASHYDCSKIQTAESTSPQALNNVNGYLGATSFSSFLQETQTSLSHLQGGDTAHRSLDGAATSADFSPSHFTPGALPRELLISQSRAGTTEVALHVLKTIPGRDLALILLRDNFNPNDGWVRDAAPHMVSAMYDTFGSALAGSRPHAGLLHMAEAIDVNAAQTLVEDQDDAQEWLASFSGPNLRWESLGILFNYWAVGSQSLPDEGDDELYRSLTRLPAVGKTNLLSRYHECACLCLQLCGRAGGGNTLLLFLLLKTKMLTNISHGDTSLASWRTLGEAVSVATNLGLHTMSSNSPLSITSEIKKRLFALTYHCDKAAALFTGRPPLLSQRYCSTPLPLDLGNEVLLLAAAGGGTEERWRARVDEQGWNVDGRIYSTTLLRARVSMSVVRDEILEMTLGVNQDVSVERLLEIKAKELDVYSSFPPAIVYTPSDATNYKLTSWTLYSKIVIRLDHLQNLFFTLRLLIKARPPPPQPHHQEQPPSPPSHHPETIQLLENSFETMCISLVLWSRRDTLSRLKYDFDWIVVSYACPAAGVLCVELLKPDSALHTRQSGIVRRSAVVQSLSQFAGFLDWMVSCGCLGTTGSTICGNVRQVVRGVLEHVLDVGPPLTVVETAARSAQEEEEGPDMGLGVSASVGWDLEVPTEMEDMFGFELLDTFGWLRP